MGFVVSVNGVQRIFIPIRDIKDIRITQESKGIKGTAPQINHTEIEILTDEK